MLSPKEISDIVWERPDTEIIDLKEIIKQLLQRGEGGIPELAAVDEMEKIKDEVKFNLNYKIDNAIRTNAKQKFRFSEFDSYKLIGIANIASSERTRELLNLSSIILNYMSDCNSMLESMKCEPIFAATYNTFKNIPLLTIIVKNKDDFGKFIDALYMLFYDDISEPGKDLLIPEEYYKVDDQAGRKVDSEDFIIFEIKVLRTSYRHDWLVWTNPEGRTEDIATVCKRYTDKTSVLMLSNGEFYKFQVNLLQNVCSLLNVINSDLRANKQINWKKKTETKGN